MLGVAACSEPTTSVTTVSIGAHELSACRVPDRGPTDPSPFRLTLTALGPFSASGSDVERDLGLDAAGQALSFNTATTGVDAVASDVAGATGSAFIGHSERRQANRIDVLLWPAQTACAVISAEGGYPGTGAGQALGFSARNGLALVAGEDADDQRSGASVAFQTDTGAASIVPREQGALRVSRSYATVTEFGDGLLVAGGTNPASTAATEDAASTAEIFHAASGGFDPSLVELWSRRTHHAAVTLATTGETLLVGGLAPNSASSGPGQLIRQFEAISPTTKSSSISGLRALARGRVDPVALVLTNGRILVGGGYTASSDPNAPEGDPIGQVEVFSSDATSPVFQVALPVRKNRTFVALPGGGALSVASCRGEPAPLRGECACFTADGAACPDASPDDSDQTWLDAWWIDPDGNPTTVTFAPDPLTPCATTDQPLLVAGSDGAPWLVSPPGDGTPACLWRFQAWPEVTSVSGSDTVDPASRPRFVTKALTLDPSPDPRTSPLGLGPDAFVWVGSNGGLFGARFGQRGPLTRDFALLLRSDDAPFRPAHLVPDRDATRVPTGADTPPVAFDPMSSALTLVDPIVTMWVADTLYDSVTLSLDIEPSDGSVPALPVLVFQTPMGATASCVWSAPPPNPTSMPVTITAKRDGTRTTLSEPNGADSTCAVPSGPLAVGIRAGSAAVTLGKFELARSLLE